MITFKEIKNFCEKNNIRHEIRKQYGIPHNYMELVDGEVKWVEHRAFLGYEIGMNNIAGKRGQSEWQWIWFETIGCYDEDGIKDDTELYFRERYSQVNGTSYKGWREGCKAVETIKRRLGEVSYLVYAFGESGYIAEFKTRREAQKKADELNDEYYQHKIWNVEEVLNA